MRKLVRRRLPWSIATQPAERQYQRRSLLLLVVASAFLVALAHYQTVGTLSKWTQSACTDDSTLIWMERCSPG